jgi:hypothetical protein
MSFICLRQSFVIDIPHHIQTLSRECQYSLCCNHSRPLRYADRLLPVTLTMFPLRSGREYSRTIADDDALGEGALELGEDLNPVSAPAPVLFALPSSAAPLLSCSPGSRSSRGHCPTYTLDPPFSLTVVAAAAKPAVEEPALLAHLCGSPKINPLTRFFAGSGSAPPAYLLTTSTTCLMV